MDRVKTTKGAGNTATVALMLALGPLILALPAAAAPCGNGSGTGQERGCPIQPGRPGPPVAPGPTATATVVPKSPTIPPAAAPAPPASAAPNPAATAAPAPAVDPGILPPAEAPPATASPAAGAPTPAAGPAAAATQPSGDRGVPGAILLALGGLLVAVCAFLDIRKAV